MRSEPLYNINESYRITNEEYQMLHDKFDKYAKWAAWQLIKRNTKNSHTDEWDDIYQEAIWSMVRAASYYKRQTYIEKCFVLLEEYIKDEITKVLILDLKTLWENRKKHGASKQKFGNKQENILDEFINNHIPKDKIPSKKDMLIINKEFSGYCKSVALNTLKSIGKAITKEKPMRDMQISIDNFDYALSYK